ncbi:MAG TPA: nuclear transport factor 2 family protein [Chloroflexota bacterium]|jgi:ketosteroid isomerase-like protein|nr:nuclear transport factor 2 family protein [Chloroflexota bacterium]
MTERHSRRSALLRRAYEAFNQRDIEAALALMDAHVEWPNVLEATTLHGHDAVRAYWLAQFETIDPRVEPEAFEALGGEEIVAAVHQVVRDRAGSVLGRRTRCPRVSIPWRPGRQDDRVPQRRCGKPRSTLALIWQVAALPCRVPGRHHSTGERERRRTADNGR